MGCRCGSVGNAVASNTRSPRFESSHMKYFMMTQYSVNCRNDENKEKDAGMAHFFKKNGPTGKCSEHCQYVNPKSH